MTNPSESIGDASQGRATRLLNLIESIDAIWARKESTRRAGILRRLVSLIGAYFSLDALLLCVGPFRLAAIAKTLAPEGGGGVCGVWASSWAREKVTGGGGANSVPWGGGGMEVDVELRETGPSGRFS